MRMEELLQKLRERDLAAYNYVYETYGWELHSYLQDRCADKETAAEVFRRAMNSFCDELAAQSEADLLELVLRVHADRVLRELKRPAGIPDSFDFQPIDLQNRIPSIDSVQLPVQQISAELLPPAIAPADGVKNDLDWEDDVLPDEEAEGQGSPLTVIGKILLILLLLIAVTVAVWSVLGIVMKMGWIPGFRLDLGYTWFNQNIAPWF